MKHLPVVFAMTISLLAAIPSSPSAAASSPRCTITGTNHADRIVGTRHRDVICARGGNDRISGMGGGDTIYAGAGNDVVNGGAGADVIYGGAGADTVSGGAGVDVIQGGGGADLLSGGAGNDEVSGGPGRDRCLTNPSPADADDPSYNGAGCERWGYQLDKTFAESAEHFRRIMPSEVADRGLPLITGWRHCLISNCGNTVGHYCAVTPTGDVEQCWVWDGYGNGWADAVFAALKNGDECGMMSDDLELCDTTSKLGLTGDEWIINQNGRYMGPGSFLLEPGTV